MRKIVNVCDCDIDSVKEPATERLSSREIERAWETDPVRVNDGVCRRPRLL